MVLTGAAVVVAAGAEVVVAAAVVVVAAAVVVVVSAAVVVVAAAVVVVVSATVVVVVTSSVVVVVTSGIMIAPSTVTTSILDPKVSTASVLSKVIGNTSPGFASSGTLKVTLNIAASLSAVTFSPSPLDQE